MPETTGNTMIGLGLMSGTSLDGLDIALCRFDCISGTYSYELIACETVNYSNELKTRLSEAKNLNAVEYFALHAAYGKYLAEEVNLFLKKLSLQPDFIASHGHTIFHQPASGFTTQLGCGATIAANTGIKTVSDLRSLDVALGGQGAPLVPVGDKYLFGDYEACLNIGGIANISFDDSNGTRIAYDVCEANMLLNLLAEREGKPYDKNGEMARAGYINKLLLDELNQLDYYLQKGAKSIGREWFEENVEKRVQNNGNTLDLLATCTEHIATIITDDINRLQLKNILVSGGGVFNTFLLERIRSKTSCEIIIPAKEVVNFKEALIFAFLGYLRINQKTNTLSSVTGAQKDSIGGAVYMG